MKVTTQIFSVALVALVVFACKNTTYKKTKEGFPYKVFSEGKGEKIIAGNVVRYHITNKLGDSILMTSYGTPARWLGIAKTGDQGSLGKILLEASKGDSIVVIQPVDSIIAQSQQPVQDSFLLKNKGKEIKTFIRVVEVFKDDIAAREVFEKENMENYFKEPMLSQQRTKDEAEIDAFIKANNITAKRSPWGVYVQTLSPGNGPKPKYGDFVTLKYTGKSLKGEVFDSNIYPLQIGAGGSIIGFEDGAKQLSKGEKAVIIVPSVIAYGAQGQAPKIAPNQNLLFEMEVLDISDKAPAPPTMPMPDTSRK